MKAFIKASLGGAAFALAIATPAQALTIERVALSKAEVAQQMAVTETIKLDYHFAYTCPYCPRVEEAIISAAGRFGHQVELNKFHTSDTLMATRYKSVYEFLGSIERPDVHKEMFLFAQKHGRKFEKADAPLETFLFKHDISIDSFQEFQRNNGYASLIRPTIAETEERKRLKKDELKPQAEEGAVQNLELGPTLLTPTVVVNDKKMINGMTAGHWNQVPAMVVNAVVQEMKSQINR